MTPFRTSPYRPQWNEKIKCTYRSFKAQCIRPGTILLLEDPRRLVDGSVEHYKKVRMNSAVGCFTPKYMLVGRQPEIHVERD